MWLAFIMFVVIALAIVGLVWGTLWIAVPAILLVGIGVAFHMTVLRAGGDSTGRLEKGGVADPEGRGRAEDAPGSSGPEATGYAHGGQPHMTPEQMDRSAS